MIFTHSNSFIDLGQLANMKKSASTWSTRSFIEVEGASDRASRTLQKRSSIPKLNMCSMRRIGGHAVYYREAEHVTIS